MRAVPKPNHFKRILRKKTHEESRLKGEYKVECKKWSAKGKCRKASADREPTTDANTLGGSDHVRIHIQVAKQVRTVPVRGCDVWY